MFIGSLVVKVSPGRREAVEEQLRALPGIEIAAATEEGVAVVIEAPTVKQQRARHEEIESWPDVEKAFVVFQSIPETEV